MELPKDVKRAMSIAAGLLILGMIAIGSVIFLGSHNKVEEAAEEIIVDVIEDEINIHHKADSGKDSSQ